MVSGSVSVTDLQSYLCGHVLICLSFRVITVYVLCQNNLHNVKFEKWNNPVIEIVTKAFHDCLKKIDCSE